MTSAEMRTALATGFNKQGRRVSDSMSSKYLASLHQREMNKQFQEEYRGFQISGKRGTGHVFVSNWQKIFTSVRAARGAVDCCLEIRSLMEVK
jgi:hypothetical protein